MTDQPTTTEQAMTAEPARTDRANADRSTTEQPAATDRPMGTRELRDAQTSSEQAPGETRSRRTTGGSGQQRPPIQATGEAATTETASRRSAAAGAQGAETRENAPLFDDAAGRQLRERWLVIQTEFVDEPRVAVQKADALVAEVLKQLTDTFAREREDLEAGWSGSTDGSPREISTEDLRQAIQRYRSFFNRLLAL